jgi:hypothetical protein
MFRSFVTLLIMISIFVWSYIFTKEPFELYFSYLVFAFLFPFFFMRYGVPKLPVYVFLPILISGLTYVAVGLNEMNNFMKVFMGFFLSTMFFHYVIELYNYDFNRLFRMYMRACVVVSVIGLFQLMSFLVGFKPGYNYTWLFNKWSVTAGGLGIRINSIFSEPAYFAAVVAPAFFASTFNLGSRSTLFIGKRGSIIIFITYLLTFSSVGILGVFLVILLIFINLGFVRYAIFFIPVLIFAFQYSYEEVPEFRDRYDGTIEIFTTANYKSYDIHGSSFVLYNNYHVALENFKRNPLFGTGLGSHPVAFDKYSLTNLEGAVDIDFNKMDANSMLLRLFSETGIYGVAVMLLLLFRNWIFKSTARSREHWVMSNALACIILLYLLRQGHYFLNGFPFFIWMFYYLAKDNRGELDGRKKPEIAPEPDPPSPKQLSGV